MDRREWQIQCAMLPIFLNKILNIVLLCWSFNNINFYKVIIILNYLNYSKLLSVFSLFQTMENWHIVLSL